MIAFLAAAWLTATPFSFQYAGREADWIRSSVAPRSVVRDRACVRTVREWTSPDGKLVLRSTETAYDGFPVREFLPELVARGETEIVDGFRSLDFARRTASARLRLTRGSACALADFEAVPVTLGGADGTNAFVQVSDFLGSSTQWTPWFGVGFADGASLWAALGWSGTWRAEHALVDGAYRLRVGMTETHFRLRAGETLRLPSVLLFENADLTCVHRFMRTFKAPRNAKGELIAPVMPIQGGGGNKSAAFLKKVVSWSKANGLPFDCFWIDAGWNGSAHETDRIRDCGSQWMNYIGDWRFNPKVHPAGSLRGVADAVHAAGMKMLLWFSPEHATARPDCAWMPVGEDRKGDWTPPPVYREHPDWFLPLVGGDYGETLATLDMGNPEARAWIVEESSRIIRENALDVFRVDVNADHVPRWRAADAPDRKGVAEAKFVAGVYAYWDELRRRFPDLLIDSCASGCRRLDFEAVSRSHCYCRTDYAISHHGPRQLVAQQNGLLNTLAFMPFQGISSAPAVFFDDYSFYSTLGPCTLFGPSGWYWDHGLTERDFTAEEIAWFKKVFGVANRARPYFLGDLYPLVDLFEPAPYNNPRHQNNYDPDPEERRFFAYQMHRADLDAGFVAVFRRVNVHANVFAATLGGVDPSATYEVEIVDGEKRRMSGAELRDFRLPMPRLRDVRLVFYRKVAAAARLTREAQNVIDNLMALQRATPRRYVVSWTHPWPEYGRACAQKDASGKWVPKALDEIRLDGYVHGRTGKDPILYFTDFYCGLGTWLGQAEYARNLANMEGFVKKAYDSWRSVPVFSWHLGNPYAPHRKDLPKLAKGEDYRYRHCCEGYPQEHRYVFREILEGTGARCGEGRADAKDAGDLPPFANPRAWYDWHLDRICEFLKRLVDRNGRPIPVVVRLFHECEDDWQWWGRGSVSRDDYVRLFRYTVAEIRRRSGLKSVLFMYSPDRYWQTCENRDSKDDFLYRYPGDDAVDIIGFDDYSLGGVPKKWKGDQASGIRASLAETVRKARLVSAFSLAHGKPAGIVETSAGKAETITGLEMKLAHGYGILREIMNSDGVTFAYFNTWGGNRTVPSTETGKVAWKEFLNLPEALVAGKGFDLTAAPEYHFKHGKEK